LVQATTDTTVRHFEEKLMPLGIVVDLEMRHELHGCLRPAECRLPVSTFLPRIGAEVDGRRPLHAIRRDGGPGTPGGVLSHLEPRYQILLALRDIQHRARRLLGLRSRRSWDGVLSSGHLVFSSCLIRSLMQASDSAG
jgi:hypothetical protein